MSKPEEVQKILKMNGSVKNFQPPASVTRPSESESGAQKWIKHMFFIFMKHQ